MTSPFFSYTAEAVYEDDALIDICIHQGGKKQIMLGRGGKKRECQQIDPFIKRLEVNTQPPLPVLLGSGTGQALTELLVHYDGPVAVVDKEQPILNATCLAKKNLPARVLWIADDSIQAIMNALTKWQVDNGGRPMLPLIHPFYLRLDRDFYQTIKEQLAASDSFNFWEKASYPKFASKQPRLLLITSHYFLMGEIITACDRLDIPYHLLTIENDAVGQTEFVEKLLKAVLEFKPDFAFTINHLGVDKEGVLTDLLERLQLPLASWFVDNPELILYLYNKLVSPWTTIFTWDVDNIPALKTQGFEHVHYLPLGTDPVRFSKPASIPHSHPLKSDVSFVGNSMVYKVAHRMKAGKFSRPLLTSYKLIAEQFAEHDERSVRKFLEAHHPELHAEFCSLHTPERQLSYEAMITWEATRQYRSRCVEQTLPFTPLIVGDKGWEQTFKSSNYTWRRHAEIGYYDELPHFYPLSTINFNCTSKQMKGAVNQRVFDVPATGAFVLTDWRVQIENLFEPGKEVICYNEPEEAGDLIKFYLANKNARNSIITAARKRILAEHSYEFRVQQMIARMKQIYG